MTKEITIKVYIFLHVFIAASLPKNIWGIKRNIKRGIYFYVIEESIVAQENKGRKSGKCISQKWIMYNRIIYIIPLVDISHKVGTEENMISYQTLIMSVR